MEETEIFQLYHTECLKAKTGVPPRKIGNFDKFLKSQNFPYFQKFRQTVERAGEMLNVELFMRALAEHHHGFFPPKAFVAPSAMRIYREFLKDFSRLEDPADIYVQLLSDCQFVSSFCVDNHLFDGLLQYMHKDEAFIPAPVKHCYSGKISFFFLAACEHFPVISQSYPKDSLGLIDGFDFRLQRSKLIHIDKCRIICDNLEKFIGMLIVKKCQ